MYIICIYIYVCNMRVYIVIILYIVHHIKHKTSGNFMNKKPLKHTQSQMFLKCRADLFSLFRAKHQRHICAGSETIEVKATSQEPPPGMMIPEASAVSYPFFLPPQKIYQTFGSTRKVHCRYWYSRKKHNNNICH